MKKILFIAAFLIIGSSIGCKKLEVCASCTESKSHYVANDYCGTPQAVDLYIETLKREGSNMGQSWSCTKH